jgi:hypothetical protein
VDSALRQLPGFPAVGKESRSERSPKTHRISVPRIAHTISWPSQRRFTRWKATPGPACTRVLCAAWAYGLRYARAVETRGPGASQIERNRRAIRGNGSSRASRSCSRAQRGPPAATASGNTSRATTPSASTRRSGMLPRAESPRSGLRATPALSARLGSEVFIIGMRGVKQPEQCLESWNQPSRVGGCIKRTDNRPTGPRRKRAAGARPWSAPRVLQFPFARALPQNPRNSGKRSGWSDRADLREPLPRNDLAESSRHA